MKPKQPSATEDRPDPQTPSTTVPLNEERRLYRPDDRPETARAIFSDWASI